MLLRYIGKRILLSVFVLFGVTLIVFSLLLLAPGDPVDLMTSESATEEQKDLIRAKYGLDQPAVVQYAVWMKNVLHGDLGESLFYDASNIELILAKLPYTAVLAFSATVLSLVISLPLGILSGIRRGGTIDMIAMLFALLGQALSPVWLGLLLILIFAVNLGWLPAMGYTSWQHLVLPSFALGIQMAALITRLLRANMINVLQEDYITSAYAKGAKPLMVNGKFALKNASIPVVTVVGMQLATYLGGAVTTEKIFSWPGLGQLTVAAIGNRDYQLVQAIILFTSLILVGVNLLVDILYTVIDPRLNISEMG